MITRDRPPLHLTVNVVTPPGVASRWASDDPRPGMAPSALTFSTAMPGGFESFECQLNRNPDAHSPDLDEFSRVTVEGVGGQVAWEGRLEALNDDSSGAQRAVGPSAVGYQSHLNDDNSAREIFVDSNIGNWRGPSGSRLLEVGAGDFPMTVNGFSVAPDASNSAMPALTTEIDDQWDQFQGAEAWYDARGIPLGQLSAAWSGYVSDGSAFPWDAVDHGLSGFVAAMGFSTYDGGGVGTGFADEHDITADGSFDLVTAEADRIFAILGLATALIGGTAGVNNQLFWRRVGVYGRHGLPLHYQADADGSDDLTVTKGVIASDVIAYLLGKYAPQIGYSADTIQPSAFVIPHLAFLDPSTVAAMLREAIKYELLDWAVWEGPTFWMNARGQSTHAKRWRARTGPAQLRDAGLQVAKLWNGVIVQYADVSGSSKTVGPPGSGCDTTDARLLDTDPQNPVNHVEGLRRWAPLQMGLSTAAGALRVGEIFLEEQKKLNHAGEASLTGYVTDDKGVLWPAWRVRAGDEIAFVDSNDSSYRRIVHTGYDDSSKTNAIQLDQPPDSLQAILERLSVVLLEFGLS